MPMCERCWSDAYNGGYGDQAERYQELVKERDASDHVCTPEQQAGPDAGDCPECGRRALHQYTGQCTNCGWRND